MRALVRALPGNVWFLAITVLVEIVLAGIVFFLLPTVYALAAIAALIVAVIVPFKPEIGLYLYLAAVSFWDIPLTSAGRGLPDIRFPDVFFLLTAFAWGARAVSQQKFSLRLSGWEGPLTVMWLYCVLTLFWVQNKLGGAFYMMRLTYAITAMVLIVQITKERDVLKWARRALMFGAFLASVIALGSFAHVMPKLIKTTQVSYFGMYRSAALEVTPNFFASFLSYTILLSLALAATETRWRYKLLYLVGLLVIGMAFLTTLSRGSWIASTGAVCAMCLLARRTRWLVIWSVVYGLAAFVIIYILAVAFDYKPVTSTCSLVAQRAFTFLNPVAQEIPRRLEAWETSKKMFFDSPICGVGAGNWATNARNYGFYRLNLPHSLYWLILCEQGAVGFTIFTAVVATLFWILWQGYQRAGEMDREFLAAAIGGCVTYFVGGMVYAYRFFELEFWVAMALGVSLAVILKEESRKEEHDGTKQSA